MNLDDPEILDAMARDAVRRRKVKRDLAAIPPRVQPHLDNPDETEAVQAVRAFMASDRTLLVISGGVGTGKTIAGCVALEVAFQSDGKGPTGTFLKAIDLVRAGSFNTDFWSQVAKVPVLVVDDLGTEPLDDKGWIIANIHALLDSRYDHCLKTIFTTNLPADKFKARYGCDGGRLIDRLREVGTFISLAGSSMRSAGGTQ